MKTKSLLIFFLLVISFSCKPPVAENPPEYVGTWKGTNVEVISDVFQDVEVILTESDFAINLYDAFGGTVLLDNSIKGTHGELSPNTVISLNQTHTYLGENWTENPETKYTEYSISGNTMNFKYDYDDPHDEWDIDDQLIKQ